LVRIWCVPVSELDRQHLWVNMRAGTGSRCKKCSNASIHITYHCQCQCPTLQSNQPYKYTGKEYMRDRAELAERQQKSQRHLQFNHG